VNVFDWIETHPEGDAGFEPALLGRPTKAQPGTHEKLAVLRRRVLCGVELFHPEDKTCFDMGGPC
jgi:hypothetical protein